MRVLITASTLPRWERDAVPAFVLDQAIALTRAVPGLEVDILAPHHAGAARAECMEGIPVYRFRYFWPTALQKLAYPAILPNLRHNGWLLMQVPFLLLAEFFAVLRHCRRRRPDVIYSHWFAPQGLAAGSAAMLLGIPHVLTSHSSDVRVMRRIPVLGPVLVRFFVRRLHACTVVSRRTLEHLRSFFPQPDEWQAIAGKVRVLPMGVRTADFSPGMAEQRLAARERLNLAGRKAVLFLGRLTEKKGLLVLLDAFSRLAPRHPDLLLVIAGEGELRQVVERRVRELGLGGSVRMPGFVSGQQKRDLLVSTDLMVVPSIITEDNDAEGLPVALLEGLAAGLLCIATDVSGADDILTDGLNGFLVPQQDPERLARAMERALQLHPAAQESIAAEARRRAAEFDWSVVAIEHYRHLLAGIRAA